MNAVRRIAPATEPSATNDPSRDAYLAWCAECQPVLRLILLGATAEIERWTLAKAQARRVSEQVADLNEACSAMAKQPTADDRSHAAGMAERIAATRAWLLDALPGTPAQVLARLVRGSWPEALLALADVRTLPPPSREADRHARYAERGERGESRSERMRAPPGPDEDRF